MLETRIFLQVALGFLFLSGSIAPAMAGDLPVGFPDDFGAVATAQAINTAVAKTGTSSPKCSGSEERSPDLNTEACDWVAQTLSRAGHSKLTFGGALFTGTDSYWRLYSTGSRPVAACVDPKQPTHSYCVVTAKPNNGQGDFVALMGNESDNPHGQPYVMSGDPDDGDPFYGDQGGGKVTRTSIQGSNLNLMDGGSAVKTSLFYDREAGVLTYEVDEVENPDEYKHNQWHRTTYLPLKCQAY